MVEIIKDKKEYKKIFEISNASFLQSWEWGEIKKPDWEPVRISLNNFPISIQTKKIPFTSKKFGYISRGFWENLSESNLKEFVEFVGDNLRVSHLIVDPNMLKGGDLFLNSGFEKTGKSIQPNWTNSVMLDKSEEDIFSNFKATYRRNIRKAQKLGCECEIFEEGKDPLDRFYKIMESIFSRTKYIMHGKGYFEKIWEILSNSKMARIYICTRTGKDIGALFIVFDKKGAYELYGGVNEEGKKNRAGFFLRECTIFDAKKLGKEFYDQWGVAKFDENGFDKFSEMHGISLFKEGYGGKNIEFLSQYTYVYDKFGYFIYKIGIHLNNLKIKFSKALR